MPAVPSMAKRGPRVRALESSPAVFADGISYDPSAGVPTGEGYPTGKYKNAAEAAQPTAGESGTQKKPFTVKGNP